MRSHTLLAAATALLFVMGGATAAPSNPGRTVFEVTRNGQPFGRHTITVAQAGDDLRVQSVLALRAGLGPLTVFRMEQTCSETWTGGALTGMSCDTLKEGRRTEVRARLQDNRLRVTGAEGEIWFPRGAFPTSWWTQPPLDATTMIDTETGAPRSVRVSRMGRETIEVGGQHIEADRIRVAGTVTADLWYDLSGRWVRCTFTARSQRIEYTLTSPLSGAPA